ncbi:MAG: hypothetical protein EPO39_07250 [Candidatus Manganitrophaceae bacterium]|nr:MAG: hypothetical protein EPO39_07250 [Candidatus Manganitrophaceae bacterium]
MHSTERQVGALHIHSSYSHDAEWPLARCKEVFKREGYHFLAMTEHAEGLDRERATAWLEECDRLSDPEFLVMPGLEFSVGRNIHLLGFGVRKLLPGRTVEALIDQIHEAGGVAVWAHPLPAAMNLIYPAAEALDGMEIWNSRYHKGSRLPLRLLRALEKLRETRPAFHGFAGIDFHKGSQDRRLSVAVESPRAASALLEALRAGRFTIQQGPLSIPSTGALSLKEQIRWMLQTSFLKVESNAVSS